MNCHENPFRFRGKILNEEVRIGKIWRKKPVNDHKLVNKPPPKWSAYKGSSGDLYRLVYKGKGHFTYARIVQETSTRSSLKDTRPIAGLSEFSIKSLPDNWELFSDTSKMIFTPDELNLYTEFKAVNFRALRDILIRDCETKLDLNMISDHRIVEEMQLTHILVDLLRNKVCTINPNTTVASNKVLQVNTHPPVCEYLQV